MRRCWILLGVDLQVHLPNNQQPKPSIMIKALHRRLMAKIKTRVLRVSQYSASFPVGDPRVRCFPKFNCRFKLIYAKRYPLIFTLVF